MRYTTAVKLYFSKTPQSQSVMRKLMRWDVGKSIEGNARALKIKSLTHVWRFAKKYRLKYKRRKYSKPGRPPAGIIERAGVEKLHKMGYTYRQIAKLHNVSRQRIWQIKHEGRR